MVVRISLWKSVRNVDETFLYESLPFHLVHADEIEIIIREN